MRYLANVIGRLTQGIILFAAGVVGGGMIFTVANASTILS